MRTNRCRQSFVRPCVSLLIASLFFPPPGRTQTSAAQQEQPPFSGRDVQKFNQSLQESSEAIARGAHSPIDEYRIGADDLLDITVFEAPEMNRTLRVSSNGEISLELLGPVKASGLTPQELETSLQEMLRNTYIKNPHVGVFVRELQSRAISVVGAVKMPGVYQIRGAKTVIEALSMAQGLSEDAGDTVLIMHGAGGSVPRGPNAESNAELPVQQTGDLVSLGGKNEIEEINLKNLLESSDFALNVPVHPGDIVKVTRAGIVYVVGEVTKPGGFPLKSNENISVLQALALAEGLTRTSSKSQARIIRTDPKTDKRTEIPVDLGKVLASKAPDLMLQPKDIVFVPNSSGKVALYQGAQAALTAATGVAIYGRY